MPDDDRKVKCDNCDWAGTESQMGKTLFEMEKLWDRIDPGCEVPAGECPECGACCYLDRVRAVYVYISGGNCQGASGPRGIGFVLLDKDNYDQEDEEFRENFRALEKERDDATAAGDIVPIF